MLKSGMKRFISKTVRREFLPLGRLIVLESGLLFGGLRAGAEAPAPEAAGREATITSDQLELVQNGAESIFTGHVVLTRTPYVLNADRMARVQATGVVEAQGHIVGTWVQSTGEKTVAVGERARYAPQQQTVELWEGARLTHWESLKDADPLVVTAGRFIAHLDAQILDAQKDVVIRRGTSYVSHSDQAKYEQPAGVLHLWGSRPIAVEFADAQGSGHFISERGLLYLSPRKVRLIDDVTGQIIPAPR